MKSTIVPNPETNEFKPISIQLTFETHDELLAFLTRLDLPHKDVCNVIHSCECFFNNTRDYASWARRQQAESSGAIMHVWSAIGKLVEHCGKYK